VHARLGKLVIANVSDAALRLVTCPAIKTLHFADCDDLPSLSAFLARSAAATAPSSTTDFEVELGLDRVGVDTDFLAEHVRSFTAHRLSERSLSAALLGMPRLQSLSFDQPWRLYMEPTLTVPQLAIAAAYVPPTITAITLPSHTLTPAHLPVLGVLLQRVPALTSLSMGQQPAGTTAKVAALMRKANLPPGALKAK
jgi:hypothetical protein